MAFKLVSTEVFYSRKASQTSDFPEILGLDQPGLQTGAIVAPSMHSEWRIVGRAIPLPSSNH